MPGHRRARLEPQARLRPRPIRARHEIVHDRLVTVAIFGQMVEAQIARGKLMAHGISCFVTDEHTATLQPHYMAAQGGIRLQVIEPIAARATEILEDAGSDQDDHDDEPHPLDGPRCPACGAQYAYYQWTGAEWLLALLFFGLPFLVLRKKWRCKRCYYAFELVPRSEPGGPYRRPLRDAGRGRAGAAK